MILDHAKVSNINRVAEDRCPGRAVSVSAGVYPPLIAGWAELCLRVSMAGTAKHTAITELSTILTHCPRQTPATRSNFPVLDKGGNIYIQSLHNRSLSDIYPVSVLVCSLRD